MLEKFGPEPGIYDNFGSEDRGGLNRGPIRIVCVLACFSCLMWTMQGAEIFSPEVGERRVNRQNLSHRLELILGTVERRRGLSQLEY
jgi:hypothetical protein